MKRLLEKAAQQGFITDEQINPLYDFLQKEKKLSTNKNKEPIRFIKNFSEIFITIGVLWLFFAIFYTIDNTISYSGLLVFLILLSEFLVKIKKMVLPGMAIIVISLYILLFKIMLSLNIENNTILSISATAFSFIFYLRYKLPFSMAIFIVAAMVSITFLLGFDIINNIWILSLYGFVTLFLAIWFDSQDIKRDNYKSDTAFWLHLVAAPLIAHSLMSDIIFTDLISKNILIIILFILFFFIAILLDRRALLLSSLGYVIYAIIGILHQDSTKVIFILFGFFILIVGVFWYQIRNTLLKPFGNNILLKFTPPIEK